MRADWLPKGETLMILSALYPQNRLALEVSLATGLRINDVLALKTPQVQKGRFTVHEEKTGKTRLIRLPIELQKRCIECSGELYVFQNRLNGRKHRTRQAVFKDLKRCAKAFRVKENLTPHSMRKIYAVEQYAKDGNLQRVKKLLNHSSEAVTLLYAMANIVDKRKHFKITKNRKG